MRRVFLAGSLFVVGCTTPRDWNMVASTLRLEGGVTDVDTDGGFAHKHGSFNSDGTWIGLSFAPFAYLEPAKEVIVRPALPNEDTGVGPFFKATPHKDDGTGKCVTCHQTLPQ